MSNLSLDFSDNTFQPLAARMRPENLAQYIGQQHLLAAGKPLPRAIEAGHLHSMILWGPPGTGKTTLAEVIARYASADVERISAVTSGVKEIREAIERARQNRNAGRRTILFVDEVHRFNSWRMLSACFSCQRRSVLLLNPYSSHNALFGTPFLDCCRKS
ncbi:AAA family ATPase, partial [Salmonella enterica subsp. enterica serovar Kentucky]|nr:AAA family ATPase [Salmonella enterica subsp. enterica serovar Kentucky]